MLNIHSSAKEHNIDQNTLGRYADNFSKFQQVEHNEMKPNYVVTSVAKSNVNHLFKMLNQMVKWSVIWSITSFKFMKKK